MVRNDTIYGGALIAGVVGLLVVAVFHPTGHQTFSSIEGFRHFARIGIAVHVLALTAHGLCAYGLVGLSLRIGVGRPDVVGALTAYAMALMGTICAASASGLIAPQLGAYMFQADEATRPLARQLLIYNGFFNQAFAKFHVAASSIAILLWSVAMLRTQLGRALASLGLVVSILTVAALFSGRLQMTVHGFGLVVLAQGAWMLWAGLMLLVAKATPAAPAAAQ